MNRDPWESELERCYAAFDKRHASLREDLLETLATMPAPPVDRASHRRHDRGRLLRPSLAAAACLLLAAVAWFFSPLGTPPSAYGLEDLPRRLREVRSIYIRGTNYFPRRTANGIERPATPTETYLERPHRYRTSSADNPAAGVRQMHVVSDGERHIEINDLDKTVVLGKEASLAAEYRVESMIQNGLVQQILGGPTAAGFRKVRSERLAGVTADVYQREFRYPQRSERSRILVWLNPADGLPLQVKHYSGWADEPESLVSLYDKIEIDGPPPEHAFDFTPPPGYNVEHRDQTPDEVGSKMSGAVVNDQTHQQSFHALRFCFNIDDRAALICWARFNDLGQPRERDLEGPLGRRLELAPTSPLGDRTYANYFLRVDAGKDFHWRWSLVIPEGDERTLGDGQLVFTVIEDDGIRTRGTMFGKPLRFEREALAKWIVDAQRLTLPAGTDVDEVFTLDEIERLIDQFAKRP
jgi:outer membrane lipoprotein-sorting protein